VRSEKTEEVVRRVWDEAERDIHVILGKIGRVHGDVKGGA
jgi:hypothetical protein